MQKDKLKKFKRFLKEHGALVPYIYGVRNINSLNPIPQVFLRRCPPSNALYDAFVWREHDAGHEFWESLYYKWAMFLKHDR